MPSPIPNLRLPRAAPRASRLSAGPIFLRPSHAGNRKNPRQFTIGFHARRAENHKGGGNEPELKFPQMRRFVEENTPFAALHFRYQKNFANIRTDAKSQIHREIPLLSPSFTIDPPEKRQAVPAPFAPPQRQPGIRPMETRCVSKGAHGKAQDLPRCSFASGAESHNRVCTTTNNPIVALGLSLRSLEEHPKQQHPADRKRDASPPQTFPL
jgi:hypothetical protein